MIKLWTLPIILILIFLTGCSGPPLKLKKTAEKAIIILNSELSNVNEFSQINEPKIVDMREISETEWCLVHQITSDIFFTSYWRKVDSEWEQVELRPYVDNCR